MGFFLFLLLIIVVVVLVKRRTAKRHAAQLADRDGIGGQRWPAEWTYDGPYEDWR